MAQPDKESIHSVINELTREGKINRAIELAGEYYWESCVQFARRLVGRRDPEDIVQGVFLEMFKYLQRLTPERLSGIQSLYGMILLRVRRRCANRPGERPPDVGYAEPDPAPPSGKPPTGINLWYERNEAREKFYHNLELLPSQGRQVLLAVLRTGSQRKAAVKLGLDERRVSEIMKELVIFIQAISDKQVLSREDCRHLRDFLGNLKPPKRLDPSEDDL